MNGSDAGGENVREGGARNGGTRNGGARGESGGSAGCEGAGHAGSPAVVDSVIRPAVNDADDVPTAADVTLNGADRAARPDRVSSILVAVGPGPHSGATVDVAREIAAVTDAWLELFHVVPSDAALADAAPDEDAPGTVAAADDPDATDYAAAGERLLDAAEDRLGGFDRADRWLVEDRTAAGAVVEQSPYYDLVVVGATTTGTVGRFVFGSTTDTVVGDAEVPVVVVEADGSTALGAE
ncbi:MAG: universal stress protein [Methanobacteriota archaeon]